LDLELATRCYKATNPKELYDELRARTRGFADLINLFRGWSIEQSLPEHVSNAAKRAVEERCDYEMLGLPSLKSAIAEKFERETDLKLIPRKNS